MSRLDCLLTSKTKCIQHIEEEKSLSLILWLRSHSRSNWPLLSLDHEERDQDGDDDDDSDNNDDDDEKKEEG